MTCCCAIFFLFLSVFGKICGLQGINIMHNINIKKYVNLLYMIETLANNNVYCGDLAEWLTGWTLVD